MGLAGASGNPGPCWAGAVFRFTDFPLLLMELSVLHSSESS